MNEGIFYALFFTGIIVNYIVKLNLEGKGNKLERSNVREGIIMGLSGYLLYQTFVLPEISTRARIADLILGGFAIALGALFFIRGRVSRDE